MITGEIKNRIDSRWDSFGTRDIHNSLTILERMTYLFFMKMLDDAYRTTQANDYFLSINKYKEIEKETVVYETPKVVHARIAILPNEITAAIADFKSKFLQS